MTRRTGLSALMSVGTTMALMGMAMAQSASPAPSGSPSGSSSGYSGSSPGPGYGSGSYGSSSGGSAYGAPGGAQTAGAIDSTSTTTQTTDYASGGDYGAAPTGDLSADTAPLDNTGGEPLVITLLGSLVAGSALLMRRKLGTN